MMDWIKNLTLQDVQRYVRIGLQWCASYLVTVGMISPTATWVEPTIGLLVGLVSLAWTMYGTRLTAKVAEISALAQKEHTPIVGVMTSDTPDGQALADKTGAIVANSGE